MFLAVDYVMDYVNPKHDYSDHIKKPDNADRHYAPISVK